MFFRTIRAVIAVILCTLFVACSYFFDENSVSDEGNYNLSLGEESSVSCLSDGEKTFNNYFDGKLPSKVMSVLIKDLEVCTMDALDIFLKYTQGSEGDSYRSKEIHDFLSSVIDDYSYTEDFISEAIRLKTSLIGGSDVKVTKQELEKLKTTVHFVFKSMVDLVDYRSLLFVFDSPNRTVENRLAFYEAADALRGVIKKIPSLGYKTTGSFDFTSFSRFIDLMSSKEQQEDLRKTFRLVDSLQALLLQGEKGTIKSSQVSYVAQQFGELWISVAQFENFLKEDSPTEADSDKEPFYTDLGTVFTFPGLITRYLDDHTIFSASGGENLTHLSAIQNRIMGTLKNATDRAGEAGISLSYVSDLLDTLATNGSFPEYLDVNTLKVLIPEFFGRWAKQNACEGASCSADHISTENILALLGFLDGWQERQNWVNKILAGKARLSDHVASSNLKFFQETAQSIPNSHWADYLIIGKLPLDARDLVVLNAIYTLTVVLIKPYNFDEVSALNYGLTLTEMKEFYRWVYPLGVSLKLLDPRGKVDTSSGFIEANLFTASSSNPSRMDFFEIIEYLNISISTGKRAIDLMEQAFVSCRVPGIFDVFEYNKLAPECFREELESKFVDYFLVSMPEMQRYYEEEMDTPTRKNFVERTERSARQGFIVNELFETDPIRLMSSILQYTESLFLRFDENEDNIIDGDELKKALDHIAPGIKILLQVEMDPSQYDLLFRAFPDFDRLLLTFSLKNGRLPDIVYAEGSVRQGVGVGTLKLWQGKNIPSNGLNNWAGQVENIEVNEAELNSSENLSWWRKPLVQAQNLFRKTTQKAKQVGRSALLAALQQMRDFSEIVGPWIESEAKVKRQDILTVISGLTDFSRVNRVNAMKAFFDKYEIEFDNRISSIEDPILGELWSQLYCSANNRKEVIQWLFDNQSSYWEPESARNLLQVSVQQRELNIPKLFNDWQGVVVKNLIISLRSVEEFKHACVLPLDKEITPEVPFKMFDEAQ